MTVDEQQRKRLEDIARKKSVGEIKETIDKIMAEHPVFHPQCDDKILAELGAHYRVYKEMTGKCYQRPYKKGE